MSKFETLIPVEIVISAKSGISATFRFAGSDLQPPEGETRSSTEYVRRVGAEHPLFKEAQALTLKFTDLCAEELGMMPIPVPETEEDMVSDENTLWNNEEG